MFKKILASAAAAGLLAACGGGGGSPGVPTTSTGTTPPTTTPVTPTPTTPTTTTPVAADLIVALDKAVITNTGTEKATLTVTALDSSRNVVPSVAVAVAVDGNAVFTPISGSATGADGTFSGSIGVGADKSNRLIRYTVTSGSLTKTGTIAVSGIQLAASGALVAPRQTAVVTVTVKDSAGNAVPAVSVAASGIPGLTLAPVNTNVAGQASFSFAAPTADGSYPITLTSAGASITYDLVVQTAGATVVPAAVGAISSASAVANPVVVGANAVGSNAKQSEVRALFVGADNTPIKNVRVRFSVTSTALPGESLSTGGSIVYSDTTGVAKTSYVAPTTGSPNDGVVIRACYATTDFAANACPNIVTGKLTVTASPVSLTIGVNNIISKSASNIFYIKQFEVQAVNSAGNYAADVPLSAKVDILSYRKSPEFRTETAAGSGVFVMGGVACPNEDTNRNASLDTLPVSEDSNKDGQLTPRQADVAIGFTNVAQKTDASGLALLQLQYPQNVAGWLLVRITVTAGVSGSEGVATYDYMLGIEQGDLQNGSFLRPPYGSATNADGSLVSVNGGVADGLADGCQVPN